MGANGAVEVGVFSALDRSDVAFSAHYAVDRKLSLIWDGEKIHPVRNLLAPGVAGV